MAKPYQEAKSVLKSYLERKGYGQWVEKPPISDHFSMWGPPTDATSTAMACLVFYILKLHAKLLFGLHVCFVQLLFLDGKNVRHFQTTDVHMFVDWGNLLDLKFIYTSAKISNKTSSRLTIV